MLQEFPMFAYIPANDVARARRFYEGTIGLKPDEEIANGVTYKFAGGTACFLYDAKPSAGTSKASQAFWTVDNLERVMADLNARGVVFEDYDEPGFKTVNGILEAGGAKAAWFKDSEGNIMALIEDVR
jgi:predicted enzyme related to lactoylglutathione lyase